MSTKTTRQRGIGAIGLLLGGLLMGSTGCASLVGTSVEPASPYIGTQADAALVKSGSWPFLLDLPASAVLDTVFLPITLTCYVGKNAHG